MAAKDFFQVEGIQLDGGAAVFSGDSDPSISLQDLPVGSLYLRSNGEQWKKVGPLPNEWELFGSGQIPDYVFANDEFVFVNDELVVL